MSQREFEIIGESKSHLEKCKILLKLLTLIVELYRRNNTQ